PSKTLWYLFNGDFVDRGLHGVEVICTLLAYSLLYPQFVFLNRGNHEALMLNQVFGFADEVSKKYDADQFPALFGLFEAVFNRLPLCTLIQDSVFVVWAYVVLTDELKPYVVQFHSQALQKFTLKELIGKKHTELQ
ncbi:hypothetical protein DYB36_014076, partial [Aphanomyces astaci]